MVGKSSGVQKPISELGNAIPAYRALLWMRPFSGELMPSGTPSQLGAVELLRAMDDEGSVVLVLA